MASKHHNQCARFLEANLKQRSPDAVAAMAANKASPAAFQAGAPMLQVHDLRTSILKPASFSLSAGEAMFSSGVGRLAPGYCLGVVVKHQCKRRCLHRL